LPSSNPRCPFLLFYSDSDYFEIGDGLGDRRDSISDGDILINPSYGGSDDNLDGHGHCHSDSSGTSSDSDEYDALLVPRWSDLAKRRESSKAKMASASFHGSTPPPPPRPNVGLGIRTSDNKKGTTVVDGRLSSSDAMKKDLTDKLRAGLASGGDAIATCRSEERASRKSQEKEMWLTWGS